MTLIAQSFSVSSKLVVPPETSYQASFVTHFCLVDFKCDCLPLKNDFKRDEADIHLSMLQSVQTEG